MKINNKLLKKYNVPVPRYTSYPTIPFWNETINGEEWKIVFQRQFEKTNMHDGISLYLHLPFCESLCTYCGCNKKITANHKVENSYIQTILKEWRIYTSLMAEPPVIRELHLGGGTPTFFSPKNLKRLIEGILDNSSIPLHHEFSIEGHPNNTTRAHLETLYNLGFRRISYGVQDNDPEVQRIINRIQPIENVRLAADNAREIGFHSVNFDLIYGLPMQNIQRIEKTILQSIEMKPDRVAFYSYAHVPWTSRGQRLFNENDLPSAEEKMQLCQAGKRLFAENGYSNIGMDHFALTTDSLFKAQQEGKLHRNFMGYTSQHTTLMLGLGVSSISDAGIAFVQNQKSLHSYINAVDRNELPISRGYFLSDEDSAFRKYILDISCKGAAFFRKENLPVLNEYSFPELKKMEEDGLLTCNLEGLTVTPVGLNFIRNICSAFDLKLLRKDAKLNGSLFAKAI